MRLGSLFRLLKIRREEGPKVLLMTLYFFLAMASVSVVKSLQNALYLGRIGFDWQLPALYVALALISGVGVLLYRRLARRFSRVGINACTLLALTATLLLFFFLLQGEMSWVVTAFYLWGGIFSILLPTQGWMLSYDLYTTREAKRLFAILGTGGILGGAGGGFYASLAGERINVNYLLIHVAIVLLLMQGLLAALKRLKPQADRSRPSAPAGEVAGQESSSPLRSLFKSSYLSGLAGLVLLSAFATTMVDLQYKWVLEERYTGSPGQITEFFGALLGATFFLSALFQLFATSRLLRSLGVGAGLIVMPAAMVAGSIPVVLFAAFGTVVALKVIDGCLRTSVQKTSLELLYLPIANPETMTVKGFIDLAVFRCGDALAATFFLAASSVTGSPIAAVGFGVLTIAGAWALLSLKLGRDYARTLRRILESRAAPGLRKALRSQEAAAERTLVEALQSSSDSKSQFALAQLIENLPDSESADMDETDITEEMVLPRMGPAVSGQAPRWLESLTPLLDHPNREIAAAALHLLVSYQPEEYLQKIQSNCRCDDVPDMLCLFYLDRYVQEPERMLQVDRLLHWSRDPSLPEARVVVRLMGKVQSPRFLPVLRSRTSNGDRALARAALKSLGQYGDQEDVDLFLDRLRFHWSRGVAVQALALYGDPLVDRLLAVLGDPGAEIALKREIPLILTRIGSRRAQDALLSSLYLLDPMVSFRALKGLNKIRARASLPFGEVSFSPVLQIWVREYYELLNLDLLMGPAQTESDRLLKKAVRERIDWGTEKIFRGLELFLPPGDAYFSYLGFTSHDPELRENAIELIDLRIKGELRQTILPIITGHSQAEVVRRGRRLYQLPSDLERVLSDALFLADPWLKCCIIADVKSRGWSRLKDRVRQAGQDIHPIVRETSIWALSSW